MFVIPTEVKIHPPLADYTGFPPSLADARAGAGMTVKTNIDYLKTALF